MAKTIKRRAKKRVAKSSSVSGEVIGSKKNKQFLSPPLLLVLIYKNK